MQIYELFATPATSTSIGISYQLSPPPQINTSKLALSRRKAGVQRGGNSHSPLRSHLPIKTLSEAPTPKVTRLSYIEVAEAGNLYRKESISLSFR